MTTNSVLIEQERSVLGTMLIDPTALQRVGPSLSPEDFFLGEHQEIYKVIENLRISRKDVNVMSVAAILERHNSSVDRTYLDQLTNYYVDAEAATTFSTQITESSGMRFFHRTLETLTKSTVEDGIELPEVVSALNQLTVRLASKSFAPTEKYGEFLEKDFLELFRTTRSTYRFLGIEEVDKKILDFNPGEVIVIAARPGMGKTASMLQSARIQIEDGRTVGFISLEMSERKLLQRLIAATTATPGDVLGRLTEEEFFNNPDLVGALQMYVQNEQLIIDTGAPYDIETIERVIRKMKYVHNVDVVYLDYIQLIEGSKFDKKAGNRQQEISNISRRLKNLAMELELRVVEAAQLNRESVKRGQAGPLLSDLRDSGAIEQDASVVIFLYAYVPETFSDEQKEQYINGSDEVQVKFEIAKQRNGPVWVFDLKFVKAIGQFKSMKDDPIYHIDNRGDGPLAH